MKNMSQDQNYNKSELLILSLPVNTNCPTTYRLDCFVFPMLAITNGISKKFCQ